MNMYCDQTLSEEQCLLKCVYSIIPIIQINFLLYKTEEVKMEWEASRKQGERERERIRRARGGA
jgi:hypothetical protein